MANMFQQELQLLRGRLLKGGREPQQYLALPLPGYPRIRLAVGDDCLAVLLPAVAGYDLYNEDLENLRIRYNLSIVVQDEAAARTEKVAILETRGSTDWLELTFLQVLASVLPSLGDATEREIAEVIRSLVEMFRALARPGKKNTEGLWGELFVISQAGDPEFAAHCWHVTPHDRYDFSFEQYRIDVKTSSAGRSHHFSYTQVAPQDNVTIVIASVLTQALQGGTSILDLLSLITSRVASKSVSGNLTRTAMETLGKGWEIGCTLEFDAQRAEHSLKWFDGEAIPKVLPPPAHVFEVAFRSDLQAVQDLELGQLALMGALGRAMAAKL